MKKYVKPMIECEEFATNAYCEPCYIVKCNDWLNLKHKPFLIQYEPTPSDDRNQENGDLFDRNYFGQWFYHGSMGGIETTVRHPVTLVSTNNDGEGIDFDIDGDGKLEHYGPNAS